MTTFSKYLGEDSGVSIVKDISKNKKKIIQRLERFKELAEKFEKLGAIKKGMISDRINDMIKNLSSITRELENVTKQIVK